MLPLLLGLGLLAGNDWFQKHMRDQQADEVASQYRGLLGTAPGAMGPPDEAGNMGHTSGTGLLADPTNMQRQLEFAAGVSGLRGQQSAGVNLLNAAFNRAQQQQEADRTFGAGRDDAAAVQARFERTFGAGRDDAAAAQARWEADARRQAAEWQAGFGLQQATGARADKTLALEQHTQAWREEQAGAGSKMPALPTGWVYQPGPAGQAVAAPIPGTTDYAKGVGTMESLQAAQGRLGQMLDLLEGKETTTANGRKVRLGGVGTELYGQTAAKYSVLRGQVISDIAKLRDMGVLQEGEQKRLEEQIADPTSIGSMLTRNSTIASGYQEMRQQFKDKVDQHLRANPWLIPQVPHGFEPVKH